MAMNMKGKKTSLDEEALIYEKRDETEPEKSKWKKMDKKQKFIHFKSYYLGPLMIGIVIAALVGFFIYKDVLTKKDAVYNSAILNDSAMEMPLTDFEENFITYLKLDPKKNLASFQFYYTDSELATKVGATVTTDLTQISSMIYASTLDSMIAGEDDLKTYLDNDLFVDLSELLSEEQQKILEGKLYIPDTEKNTDKHPYGVYLNESSVYQKIFEDGGGLVEKPVFAVLVNSENKDISRQFLYYVFPELQEGE